MEEKDQTGFIRNSTHRHLKMVYTQTTLLVHQKGGQTIISFKVII